MELPAMWRECLRVVDEARPVPATVSGDEGIVLDLLGADPRSLDGLIAGAGIGPGRTAAALTRLEVEGWARQLAGQRYVRAK